MVFIWDFTASAILEQITDWIFSKLVGFLGEFFANLGNMGAEIFDRAWRMREKVDGLGTRQTCLSPDSTMNQLGDLGKALQNRGDEE